MIDEQLHEMAGYLDIVNCPFPEKAAQFPEPVKESASTKETTFTWNTSSLNSTTALKVDKQVTKTAPRRSM